MSEFTVVVFDCDGVMFDSRLANINFYNHLLKKYGLPLMNREQEAYVHMHTIGESLSFLLKGSPHEKVAYSYKIGDDYVPFLKDMVMEPGLRELLYALKSNFGLGIATNRTTTIGKVLEINDISHLFDIVISSLDVEHPKPHPESLFKILDFFKVPSHKILYVGDSQVDADMAKAAHVPFVAYKNMDLDADFYVQSHREIGSLVGIEIPSS